MKLVSFIFIFAAIPTSVFSQGLDPLGSGKQATYTLEDLPNDLVAIDITTSKDSLRSLMTMSYQGMTIRGDESGPRPLLSPEILMRLSDVVWTSKDVVSGNSEFVIGYKLDIPPMFGRVSNQTSKPKFQITYVRRGAIISMTPRDDFAPAAIKEMARQSARPEGTVAERTATLSNIKQISTAMMIFLSDTDDQFPYVQGTPQLFKMMEPYTRNLEVFKTKNPAGGAFRFNMCLAGSGMSDVAQPAETVLFYESEPWADGSRCVSFTDSHAKVVTADEWKKLQPTLNLKLKKHGRPLPPNQTAPRVK